MGYYFYCLAIPETILLVVGLSRLFISKWKCLPVPFLVTSFGALEIFGTWFVQLPYYTGMTEHNSSGNLPAGQLSQIGGEMIQRLLVNKPGFLHPGILVAGGILYIGAWLTAVSISVAISVESSE
jgi:hypothetical protein